MQIEDVSPALQERLGREGTVGLLSLLETIRDDWSGRVTNLAVERFERRLGGEIGTFRLEMREEIGKVRVELRQEIAAGDAQLREEMRNGTASLREEVRNQIAGIRVEISQRLAKLEVDLTWRMFGMWVGQLVAMAAVMATMFQIYAQ